MYWPGMIYPLAPILKGSSKCNFAHAQRLKFHEKAYKAAVTLTETECAF